MNETALTQPHVDGVGLIAQATNKPRKTVLRWLREGRIPEPDMVASRQSRYWLRTRIEGFLAAGQL